MVTRRALFPETGNSPQRHITVGHSLCQPREQDLIQLELTCFSTR